MKPKKIKDIKVLKTPVTADLDSPILELVKILLKSPVTHHLCVLDKDKKLIGLIDRKRLFQTIHAHHLHPSTRISELYQLSTAEDAESIMITHIITAKLDDDIDDVIKTMLEHHLYEIPVVNTRGNLLGVLESSYFLQAWYEEQSNIKKNN